MMKLDFKLSSLTSVTMARLRRSVIVGVILAAVGTSALSQTLAEANSAALTPRDRVVLSLIGNTKTNSTAAKVKPVIQDGAEAPDESLAIEKAARHPIDIPLPNVTKDVAAPLVVFAPANGHYGFFQTAEAYLAARGSEAAPQLRLRYKVVKADGVTGISSLPEMVTLMIGPDYAATVRADAPMQIIDFKTHRLLTVNAAPADPSNSEHFTNVSLYAARYKNIDTVRRMTRGGTLRELPIGGGRTRASLALPGAKTPTGLNAFYLESSLGFAAAALPAGTLTLGTDDKIKTAQFAGKTVFTGKFNGPNFDTSTQGYSFVSWLYHTLPIHPEILATLTDITTAPSYLKLYTESPNAPSGQTESWTLTDAVADDVPFPLPETTLSATQLDAVSPLAFVITEALYGRALGGPPDPAATLEAMDARLKAGDALAVWLSATAMADRLGGCDALSGLCDMIARAKDSGKDDINITDLAAAFSGVKTPKTRIAAMITLQEAVADPDVPSVVLRAAAMGLAKLNPNEAASAGLSDLSAEALLTQAIAKDPYDYAAYQSLAQIYAARGDFIESWDISDALRAFPDAPASMTAPFDRAEAKLIRGAPGFFPPIKP